MAVKIHIIQMTATGHRIYFIHTYLCRNLLQLSSTNLLYQFIIGIFNIRNEDNATLFLYNKCNNGGQSREMVQSKQLKHSWQLHQYILHMLVLTQQNQNVYRQALSCSRSQLKIVKNSMALRFPASSLTIRALVKWVI